MRPLLEGRILTNINLKNIDIMQALFFISTFLGIYFLISIFYPQTMFFFLPDRRRSRGLGILLTFIFVIAAIVFVSVSPAAQASGI